MNICLITGASSGLGVEFAKIYAVEGYPLLLVATNKERLLEAKEEILKIKENAYVDIFPCDLSLDSERKTLFEYTKHNDYHVNILINNAGFGDCCDFKDMDIDKQIKMVEVNCNAVLYLTRVYINEMLEKNEGYIINTSSIASFYPGPFMCTYHATKAFVTNLGEAIAYELKGTNVHILTLCPGPFKSRFVEKAHNDYTFAKKKPIDASDVASFGYKMSRKHKTLAVVGFKNKFELFLARFVSRKGIAAFSAKYIKKN